jgi:hypothetical protein
MVKQTAQMLQAFGTELAETELPNDVQSTSSVLCAHTEKKNKAKVRAGSVGLRLFHPKHKTQGESSALGHTECEWVSELPSNTCKNQLF